MIFPKQNIWAGCSKVSGARLVGARILISDFWIEHRAATRKLLPVANRLHRSYLQNIDSRRANGIWYIAQRRRARNVAVVGSDVCLPFVWPRLLFLGRRELDVHEGETRMYYGSIAAIDNNTVVRSYWYSNSISSSHGTGGEAARAARSARRVQ